MYPRPHPRPPLQLSRLRDIGWSLWDPIGLLDPGQAWTGHPAADEYDGYLSTVASLIRDAHPDKECVAYLVNVALVHMGLGLSWRQALRFSPWQGPVLKLRGERRARKAAADTVAAIRRYVEELDADWLAQ